MRYGKPKPRPKPTRPKLGVLTFGFLLALCLPVAHAATDLAIDVGTEDGLVFLAISTEPQTESFDEFLDELTAALAALETGIDTFLTMNQPEGGIINVEITGFADFQAPPVSATQVVVPLPASGWALAGGLAMLTIPFRGRRRGPST